jgi:hypothetical protein
MVPPAPLPQVTLRLPGGPLCRHATRVIATLLALQEPLRTRLATALGDPTCQRWEEIHQSSLQAWASQRAEMIRVNDQVRTNVPPAPMAGPLGSALTRNRRGNPQLANSDATAATVLSESHLSPYTVALGGLLFKRQSPFSGCKRAATAPFLSRHVFPSPPLAPFPPPHRRDARSRQHRHPEHICADSKPERQSPTGRRRAGAAGAHPADRPHGLREKQPGRAPRLCHRQPEEPLTDPNGGSDRPKGADSVSLACSLADRRALPLRTQLATRMQILLGTYVCTEVPGQFRYQEGVVTQAVKTGR